MSAFRYFDKKIILKDFDVTLIENIFILPQIEEIKSILFLDIKIRRVNPIVFLQVFIKS